MTLHRALEIADAVGTTATIETTSLESVMGALSRLAREVRDRQAGAEWVSERLYELEVKLTQGLDVDDDMR